eukprot:1154372-Pelagomonas_calceolata.AAC.2
MYNHGFDITHKDGWRNCAVNKDGKRSLIHHQVPDHTHFAPMIIEKWALPFFKKSGLQPATPSTAARTDIDCACCQMCNYHGGYKPMNSEPLYLHMYICDVCQRMYPWKCRMKELGCYTDGQRQEVNAADTWACPACAGLNDRKKKK